MAKPKEFFDFGFPEQTTFLKDGLRKKTTPEHWAFLEYVKPNGLFTQHDPELNNLAANYEAENLHIAFQHASDMGQWKKYLQDHPPSPEALAVLVILGLKEFQSQQGRTAGRASGVARKEKAQCTPQEVERLYRQEMEAGTEKRDVAAKLARRFEVSPHHIRNLLRKAENQT
jgi:hypothetical protein